MHLLIFVVFSAGLPVVAEAIDDTPGGNLTFEFDYFPGRCPDVPSRLLASDEKAYEGRWYVKYVTYSADLASRLSYFVFDLFFSTKDIFHDFLYVFDNGVVKTFVTRSTRIRGKSGEFEQEDGSTGNETTIITVLYYVDAEMVVYWDQTCFNDGSKHTRNAVVGYRNLSMVNYKQPKLNKIMKSLGKSAGGSLVLHPISDDKNSKYPPIMSNPYA